jgi:hypothetical protein
MDAEIVPNYDIVLAYLGGETLLDPLQHDLAVNGTWNNQGCDYAGQTQASDYTEVRPPITRDVINGSFANGRPCQAARHRQIHSTFVHANQPRRVPLLALFLEVLP